MRKLALTAAFLSLAFAQQTRREITNPSATDAQPNNPKVPDALAISTQFQRVVIMRFKYDTDLLAGIEKLVKEQKIQNGVILSAFGSVRNYQIHQVSNRTLPVKDTFTKDPTAPADITGMSGFIMKGRVHPHISLANPEKGFAGHLEPGTAVFTFAVVTVGVLPDTVDVTRLDDKTFR